MLTAPPVYGQAQTNRLIQTFNDLNLDLAKTDGQLERMQGQGTVPGAGWSDWFANTAENLQGARDAFMALRPGDDDLIARLGFEVRDLAESGGRIAVMRNQGSSFGTGWGGVLDSTIKAVRDASNELLTSPVPGYPDNGGPGDTMPPAPPVPAPRPQLPTTRLTADVNRAVELITQSMDTIRTVPVTDRGDESTKQARLAAFHVNLAAQQLLEQHFTTESSAVTSIVKSADDHLVDAAWQLAKKPSDDGRFHGVDIPGALNSSAAAIETLRQLGGGSNAPMQVIGEQQPPATDASSIPVGSVDYCTTPEFPRV